MLGLSKKTTRSALLHAKHTGIAKEFSEWVQQNILEPGHAVEALAQTILLHVAFMRTIIEREKLRQMALYQKTFLRGYSLCSVVNAHAVEINFQKKKSIWIISYPSLLAVRIWTATSNCFALPVIAVKATSTPSSLCKAEGSCCSPTPKGERAGDAFFITGHIMNFNELFSYNAEKGILTWKVKRPGPGCIVGNEAGNIKSDGRYRTLKLFGKRLYVHRIIWEMINGPIPVGMCIDHIDGNGLNNRLINLRITTLSGNQRNKRLHKNNRTGTPGVSHRKNGFIVACAGKYIGRYKNLEDAVAARKKAESIHNYHPNNGRK